MGHGLWLMFFYNMAIKTRWTNVIRMIFVKYNRSYEMSITLAPPEPKPMEVGPPGIPPKRPKAPAAPKDDD